MAAVGDILGNGASPQSVRELRRAMGNAFPGKVALETELRRGVSAGRYFEWPGSRFWCRDPESHVREVLLDALSAGPLPLRQVLRSHKNRFLKLPPARIALIVDNLQVAGRLHIFYDGKDRLLSLEPLPDPGSKVREIASERPLSKVALVQEAGKRLAYLPKTAVARAVDTLQKSSQLRVKGKGKAAVWFARPSDPERFIRYVVEEAVDRATSEWRELLEPMGVTFGRVAAPEPVQGPITEILMSALREMEPQRGLPVAIQKLRRHRMLQSVGKQDFDRAAAELVALGKAFPFHHTAALTLAAEERELLVDDGNGNYYVGLAWRN
jgi:hypothetical protein